MDSEVLTAETRQPQGEHQDPGFLTPDISLMLLTWFTFFLLLAILYKFAWKPILKALDAREEFIRSSLADAQKTKDELAKINETRRQLIGEADIKAKEIVSQAKKAAVETARIIEQQAREETKIILENARREIKEEKEKAESDLKKVSAEIAIELARKLIEENLDDEKNRKLINRMMKDI